VLDVAGLPTGSAISLAWDAPLDSGGGRILHYMVAYTVSGYPEAEDRAEDDTRAHTLSGLAAQTAVSGISVRYPSNHRPVLPIPTLSSQLPPYPAN